MPARYVRSAAASLGLIAAVVTGVLLVQPHRPAMAAPPDPDVAYVQALDSAEGWLSPDPATRATDLATGRTICRMLGTGWNEAGVVANMLTWTANTLTQQQLAVAVHVTHTTLCAKEN
jgi:uncharacterized protein DUF732